MLQRAISGFQQCAALANPNLPEVFDHTIRSLSKITGLQASAIPPDASTNFPTIDIDGQTVTISPLALRFGTSFKSQLAAVVLFNIANEHAALVSTSWIDVRTKTPRRYALADNRMIDLRDLPVSLHLFSATSKPCQHGGIFGRRSSNSAKSASATNCTRRKASQRWRTSVDSFIISAVTLRPRTRWHRQRCHGR